MIFKDDYSNYNDFVDKVQYFLSHDEYAEAVSLLKEVLAEGSKDTWLQRDYITALVNLNEFEEAELWLKKVILHFEESSSPSQIDALYYKGLYYFLESNPKRSMECLTNCFELNINYFKKILYDKTFNTLRESAEFKKLITPLKVYMVNNYISLKLMFSKTLIYVCDELFLSCQKIALSIAPNEFENYADFNDIDDIISFYKSHAQTTTSKDHLAPEEEFWGHCSNLQAWVENDYNTSVLSKNISFSLLKELYDRGVEQSSPIFKRELLERIKTGGILTLRYFLADTEENYLKHLTEEDLLDNLLPFEEAKIMKNISRFIPIEYTLTTNLQDSREYSYFRDDEKLHFCIKNGHITELEVSLNWLTYSEEYHQALLQVKNLNHLEELAIYITASTCHTGTNTFLKALYDFENLDYELLKINRSPLEEFE